MLESLYARMHSTAFTYSAGVGKCCKRNKTHKDPCENRVLLQKRPRGTKNLFVVCGTAVKFAVNAALQCVAVQNVNVSCS